MICLLARITGDCVGAFITKDLLEYSVFRKGRYERPSI